MKFFQVSICFLIISIFTNCKLSGKYVYKSDLYESIVFNADNTFDYLSVNDVGASKRFGIYEIKNGKVKLSFTDPPIKNDFTVFIDTLELIREPPSVFPNLYPVNNNFIGLTIIDKTTKQPINYGTIHFYNLKGNYLNGATYSSYNSPFRIPIDHMDFPLRLKLKFLEYLDCEFFLTEKRGYDIQIELVSDQGYHMRSGERALLKKQFKNRKKKRQAGDHNKQIFYKSEYDVFYLNSRKATDQKGNRR